MKFGESKWNEWFLWAASSIKENKFSFNCGVIGYAKREQPSPFILPLLSLQFNLIKRIRD